MLADEWNFKSTSFDSSRFSNHIPFKLTIWPLTFDLSKLLDHIKIIESCNDAKANALPNIILSRADIFTV